MPPLLTVNDVAARLACKPRKVRELIVAGRIYAIDISPDGNRPTYRIDEKDLAAFLASSAVPRPPEQRDEPRRPTLKPLRFMKFG
ncbi:helix-turn-helix domain-containing protein [Rosistilla oblonga]|uniref:helix-turn-helix domain-containing protein n=1 Tax=Rosistilla oblonga TaxID=2527990 RepID=UPI0018D22EB5|nr:helix-turn-helix domain-containing protein [Rosistilla oblonga]